MADVSIDVFVSYSDSELERVRPLIDALREEGWSVWWDRRILPGQTWDQVLGPALDEARCVIVVWSLTSVTSEWVRAEAEDARSRGIVVPVLLDDVRIPLQFRPIQAARLVGWSGDRNDERFASLRLAISAKLDATHGPAAQSTRELAKPSPVDPGPQRVRASESHGRPGWISAKSTLDPEGPFLLPIEDVFSITGRGTVVTGQIQRGTIKVGEGIEIVGFRETVKTVVTGIEMSRKLVDEGRAGDSVGILVRGVPATDVQRGQVLARPGSIKPHTRFSADVYLLTQQEGGRKAPIRNGYTMQCYVRTVDVAATLELPAGTDIMMPGDNLRVVIGLEDAVAIEKDSLFAIREKDRTIGAGRVLQPET